jgi:hypothetical protein
MGRARLAVADPFTYLSNRYEQRKLEASYEAEARRFASTLTAAAPASDTIEAESPEAVRAKLAQEARRYRTGLRRAAFPSPWRRRWRS